jgi:hypothetical protein
MEIRLGAFRRGNSKMKKTVVIAVFAAGVLFAADQTFTGVITDSMCPKADHSDMKAKSDADCVVQRMKMNGMKYVLWDGKKTYDLSDQKTPAKFAAKKVHVTGSLDAKTGAIQVSAIIPAK